MQIILFLFVFLNSYIYSENPKNYDIDISNQSQSKPLPKGSYLIPFSKELDLLWVFDKLPSENCSIIVDPKEFPWVLCDNRFLTAPYYSRIFISEKPINYMVWLDNGSIFAVSRDELAVVDIKKKKDDLNKEIENIKLKFLGMAKLDGMRIFPGENNSLYILGRDIENGLNKLFVLTYKNGNPSFSFITATKEKINSITGDGDIAFVVIGKKVIKLYRPDGKKEYAAKTIFENPDLQINNIHYTSSAGIFYSSSKGIGYIGDNYWLEFFSAENPEFVMKNDSIFVKLSKNQGVIKINGITAFKKKDAVIKIKQQDVKK
ncbi:MAG: hypothetical protein K6357_06830 [Elusimicrobiota bacterium]